MFLTLPPPIGVVSGERSGTPPFHTHGALKLGGSEPQRFGRALRAEYVWEGSCEDSNVDRFRPLNPATSGMLGGILGDEVMGAALIDRLLHHCHVVSTRGNSYRLRHQHDIWRPHYDERTTATASPHLASA